eukprot:2523167-Prorocentrum_lima.AAC.1
MDARCKVGARNMWGIHSGGLGGGCGQHREVLLDVDVPRQFNLVAASVLVALHHVRRRDRPPLWWPHLAGRMAGAAPPELSLIHISEPTRLDVI